MNARILSLKTKQFIWFNVVHISHPLNIPATPQRLQNILHPKGLEKGHNGNKTSLSAPNNGYQHREKPFSPLPTNCRQITFPQDFHEEFSEHDVFQKV